MKNITAMVSLLIVCLTCLQCGKELYPSTSLGVQVDGVDDEWDKSLYRKTDGTNLVYAVAQDREKLFVLVKGTDEQSTRKMTMLGMTIWLDGKGKSKKRQGIRYPQGVQDPVVMGKLTVLMSDRISGRGANQDAGGILENPEIRALMERNIHYVGLINFFDDSDEAFTAPIDALNIPLEAKLRRGKRDEVVYEMAIPLNLIKDRKSEVISVGIETHTIDVQSMMPNRMGGMSPGGFGMAGRRPGGMGGRSGGQGMEQRRAELKEMNTSTKAWLKVAID